MSSSPHRILAWRHLAARSLLTLAVLAATAPLMAQTVPADLALTNLNIAGINQPIAFAQPDDGSGRLFIVSRTGNIHIYKNGALLVTPFLNVPVSTSQEQGLLGIAFHPQFAVNGRFYVQHSRPIGGGANIGDAQDQLTVEYTVTGSNPDIADPASRKVIVTIGDIANNHNGGDIHFGPDGYLYISMGDGGVQNDLHGFAQCLWRKPADSTPANCAPGSGVNYALLGKILRIDVDGTTPNAPAEMCGVATGTTANYRIPADNPHVATNNTCNEIWHYGMRNPFRFSFDRSNGDMLVGDVGQERWEEVTLIPAASGPQNLGWKICEGFQLFPNGAVNSCNFGFLPILNYASFGSGVTTCSITGGYRYRGPITPLQGMIIYADYCARDIYFGQPGASPSGYVAARWEMPAGTAIRPASGPIGFGEDLAGNLYVGAQGGQIYKFTSASFPELTVDIFKNGFE